MAIAWDVIVLLLKTERQPNLSWLHNSCTSGLHFHLDTPQRVFQAYHFRLFRLFFLKPQRSLHHG